MKLSFASVAFALSSLTFAAPVQQNHAREYMIPAAKDTFSGPGCLDCTNGKEQTLRVDGTKGVEERILLRFELPNEVAQNVESIKSCSLSVPGPIKRIDGEGKYPLIQVADANNIGWDEESVSERTLPDQYDWVGEGKIREGQDTFDPININQICRNIAKNKLGKNNGLNVFLFGLESDIGYVFPSKEAGQPIKLIVKTN
ncbi:hypothetical protein H4219_000978 [Mycoemilia scoparia]|uniref:Uncharacterized protein n=1 Tax=Mycoemilia scoparia TaxID=417184 RepID=A0A9W8DSD5_9FUNG|nr:hypothetical protein H4219_000978 [Mycoemilia scoparia]